MDLKSSQICCFSSFLDEELNWWQIFLLKGCQLLFINYLSNSNFFDLFVRGYWITGIPREQVAFNFCLTSVEATMMVKLFIGFFPPTAFVVVGNSCHQDFSANLFYSRNSGDFPPMVIVFGYFFLLQRICNQHAHNLSTVLSNPLRRRHFVFWLLHSTCTVKKQAGFHESIHSKP